MRKVGTLTNLFEQTIPPCPRCDERVSSVIEEVGKPIKYVHDRNNQDPVIHEDVTADMRDTLMDDLRDKVSDQLNKSINAFPAMERKRVRPND